MKVTIVNPDDTEELALTLEGKKKKLKWEHFERLGKKLGLNDKQLKGMAKRFVKNKPIALGYILMSKTWSTRFLNRFCHK